jgi:amidase
MTWKETAQKKRDFVHSQIPQEWLLDPVPDVSNCYEFLNSVLSVEENEITHKTLLQLQADIKEKKLTSYEVTRAFCHRAALAHQLINCCSEIFFNRAMAHARELDEYYNSTGQLKGPLHGLPISLKDQVNLEGLDSSIGYVSLAFHPKSSDDVSVIAKILFEAGAVFYVKTAVPMAMMAPDTFSNLYGQTYNAFNKKLSAGGSSGGESSLIGCHGGLIGLSTDIGGSIRIPAAFQGLYALRGSTGRLPYCKVTNSFAFQPIVPSVIGPSAQDLNDLEFFVKLIIDSQPWLQDPKCPPIAWREIQLPQKLCFGILKHNGLMTPHPPVKRAMELIINKLKAAGHDVVEWEHPVPMRTIMDNLNSIFVADGYNETKLELEKSGEPVIPQLMGFSDTLPELTVTQHWNQAKTKYEIQQVYDKEWIGTKGPAGRRMDAWISPVWESASYPAGQVKPYHCTYTFPSNYLDYSTVVFPVTKVGEDDNVSITSEPVSADDKESLGLWDYDLFKGMPVCAQVVCLRYEEEKAIKLAGVIKDVLKT